MLSSSFISGLFALLGGFFGAWFTRKTEYQKWIRQQRGIEFSEFIRQLEATMNKSRDIIYDNNISDRDKDMQITQLFTELNAQENIVRLYLKEIDRKNFSNYKHQIWAYYSPSTEMAARMKHHKILLRSIRDLFEENLMEQNSRLQKYLQHFLRRK
ncbi:MAG: hypothetical protein HF981_13160 [Desulfobacteraceae bacterium]|nr:hypothetical protein [Desulfobacteraceae bacterium]MBC2751331.1 hypothetical protein [Desulfobacteraceae bacterium]